MPAAFGFEPSLKRDAMDSTARCTDACCPSADLFPHFQRSFSLKESEESRPVPLVDCPSSIRNARPTNCTLGFASPFDGAAQPFRGSA